MKKGRHRRFEEARALKRSTELDIESILEEKPTEPCEECGAAPGAAHAAWCIADLESEADLEEDEQGWVAS